MFSYYYYYYYTKWSQLTHYKSVEEPTVSLFSTSSSITDSLVIKVAWSSMINNSLYL